MSKKSKTNQVESGKAVPFDIDEFAYHLLHTECVGTSYNNRSDSDALFFYLMVGYAVHREPGIVKVLERALALEDVEKSVRAFSSVLQESFCRYTRNEWVWAQGEDRLLVLLGTEVRALEDMDAAKVQKEYGALKAELQECINALTGPHNLLDFMASDIAVRAEMMLGILDVTARSARRDLRLPPRLSHRTPTSVNKLLVKLAQLEDGQTIYDPAAGTLSTLLQATMAAAPAKVFAQDNARRPSVAYAGFCLPILRLVVWGEDGILYARQNSINMPLALDGDFEKCDRVITDIPENSQMPGGTPAYSHENYAILRGNIDPNRKRALLKRNAERYSAKWAAAFKYHTPAAQDSLGSALMASDDVMSFIALSLGALKDEGRAVLVIPRFFVSTTQKEVVTFRAKMLSDGWVESVVMVEDRFGQLSTVILVLDKTRKNADVLIVAAKAETTIGEELDEWTAGISDLLDERVPVGLPDVSSGSRANSNASKVDVGLGHRAVLLSVDEVLERNAVLDYTAYVTQRELSSIEVRPVAEIRLDMASVERQIMGWSTRIGLELDRLG